MSKVFLKNTSNKNQDNATKPGRVRVRLREQMEDNAKKKESIKHLPKKMRKRSKRLTKLCNADASTRYTDYFTHTRLSNICLSEKTPFDDAATYSTFSGALKNPTKHSASNILINAGHDLFYRLPYNVFKKLRKIQYVVIDVEIIVREDGMEDDDEPFMLMSKSYKISSMNQLFDYMMKRNGLYESLLLYQSGIGWYSAIEMNETVEILYNDDESKKMPMSEFLGKYNL